MMSNMQPSRSHQPPGHPTMVSSAPQNFVPPMPMQYRPVVPPQQPLQLMQPAAQQFQSVGQPMPGASIGMPEQMPCFRQPWQHMPHSGQVPVSLQVVPLVSETPRPISSAPLQSQQQSTYPGGRLPTMRGPMPPPSYTPQQTSVPPIMQPGVTALGQSAPHVTALVHPGHQLVSAPATLPSFDNEKVKLSEPSPSDCKEHTITVTSDWKEYNTTDGKKYYFNKKSKQSCWKKPVELMTPLERADASTEWKEVTDLEGQKYYHNKVTKQSIWTIPDELKFARELAKKASNGQSDGETGITAGPLVGSASVEPSTVPANQSSSAVGITAFSSHDASANSVPPDAGPPHNMDSTSGSSNVRMQISGLSTAIVPVTTSIEFPLLLTGEGSIRNTNENTYVTSAADTEDGTSIKDLEDTKRMMSVSRKIKILPLEEKTHEKPVFYANKLAMRVSINDKRYGALETFGEKRQAFYEYKNQREKMKAEKKLIKMRKARDNFIAMLDECKELTSRTRWGKAILMFEDDERFKALDHPREREDLYENYMVELHKKEKAKAAEEHKRNLAEYRAFLESCDFIKVTTKWRKVKDCLELEDDERFSRLPKIDRFDLFQEYIRYLRKQEEEKKQIQEEQTRRQERKNRDEFRKMLEEHVAIGTLNANTRWLDYRTQIKGSHAYLAVALNTSGSTPKELFDDVMDELEKQFQGGKSQITEAVKSRKIPITTSWTLDQFQTSVLEDNALKGISTINIKLIYEDLIESLLEKEQKEAKKRQELGEKFSDLLYSIKVERLNQYVFEVSPRHPSGGAAPCLTFYRFKNHGLNLPVLERNLKGRKSFLKSPERKEISASSTWDHSKQLFKDSQEFRVLDSETHARELFKECVGHLKKRLKEKERLREEEKAKREREREERKGTKEKERKERERKEKEREREKERQKKKQKDRARRDDTEIDDTDRRYYYTSDESSERDGKGNYKKSRRHGSDRKKSRKVINAGTFVRKKVTIAMHAAYTCFRISIYALICRVQTPGVPWTCSRLLPGVGAIEMTPTHTWRPFADLASRVANPASHLNSACIIVAVILIYDGVMRR
ncbi:hypothetical protein ACP4OV_031469 [Aristida adscensionis]